MAHLECTLHARHEMRRDSVSDADAYHVVEDSDDFIEGDDRTAMFTRRLLDGRQVVVSVEDTCTVVTAWLNKRGSRRRR